MGYENISGLPLGGIDLNFFSGSLNITYHPRLMNFWRTNGVITDVNGNLLFSSNGVFIANANNDTMVNGNNLNLSYYTTHHGDNGLNLSQGNLIIPFSTDSLKYYLFHETIDDYGFTYSSLFLYYSVIDMSLDSGRGAVTQKNTIMLTDSLVPGSLTGCKHANGRDWWILAHQYNSDMYYKYLVTPIGIQGPSIQNIGAIRYSEVEQVAFSSDGKKFASYEPRWNDLDIFDFDRCTGVFSNPIHINFTDSAYIGGVAFSPNSNVLYVASTSYVYQFDLTAPNVSATQTTVAVWDGYYSPQWPFASTFRHAQLAPDGKIYIVCGNSTVDIHVINNPDSLGLGCDVCQHCVPLPAYNGFTIPNHPNYFLGAEDGSVCDSITNISEGKNSDLNLNIYPNPVISEYVTFTYSTLHKLAVLSILNIEGKEIGKYNIPQWSSIQHIKLPKLAGGIYLARLESKEQVANIKFIIK